MSIRPASVWRPSPNYQPCDSRNISCIVVHATATQGVRSPLEWLCSPMSKVSAHYLIDTDGAIYHLVHESNVAWHAGVSSWRGRDGVNAFSVGIELVNANDGKAPYPPAQMAACLSLVKDIAQDHKIEAADVVGHLEIAPGRKTDPAGLDLDGFRMDVAKALKEA